MLTNTGPTQISKFVLRRLTETLQFGGKEYEGVYWLAILVPILAIGLVYVVWMYVRDGRAVGWFWGSFLALLRLTVYAIIAAVFLLPAIQNWSQTETHSRVVLGFDVSGSIVKTRDGVPSEGIPFERLPTRQDLVLNLVNDPNVAFLPRLMEKNPLYVYRWADRLDEDFLVLDKGRRWERADWEKSLQPGGGARPEGQPITREDLAAFLKPDLQAKVADGDAEGVKRLAHLKEMFSGTNVGESSLALLTREMNNVVQGVVVFTDGRSTQGSPQAFRDLADRARRANIPVFVVAVGEDRQPVKIDIADARGPDMARPNDPFPINIDVNGEGLPGRDVTIYLDVYKPGQKPGKDEPFKTLEKQETFKPAEPPRAQAEFPITPEDFGEVPADKPDEKPDEAKPGAKPEAKPTKPELAEGEWTFVPRVPKDRAEAFDKKEHTREPVVVKVVRRPMRVLLFASAAMHDYQFIRTLMVRESDKKRVELSIYLQGIPGQPRRMGVVQDIPAERLLTQFPNRLDTKEEGDKAYNLNNYDVIIAFDPDWTELTKEQAQMVESWVSRQGGGLIVEAGPINTLELAKPGSSGVGTPADPVKLKPILDLYPVVLKDKRLEKERNTTEPVRLRFPGANPEMEFLKLDEENPRANPTKAWEEFFMGADSAGKPGDRVQRGFYDFYPVQKAKDGCITVATFSDPFAQDVQGREAPYLVIQPRYGRGRVVWIGSAETWRLRQYREVWHERFWTKLARYASHGSIGQGTRRIIPNMGNLFPVGKFFEVQAQMLGPDLKPLPEKEKPELTLKMPTGVTDKDVPSKYDMTPRVAPGEWEGWFTARLLVKSPGEYTVEMKLPDSSEVAVTKFKAVEVDAEMENTRPDLGAIYDLASDADDVLGRLEEPKRGEVKRGLERFKRPPPPGEKGAAAGKESLRLVFDLKSAEVIPDCMREIKNTVTSRGSVEDLWDRGLPMETALTWAGRGFGAAALAMLVAALVFLSMGRRPVATLVGFGVLAVLSGASFVGAWYAAGRTDVTMSLVLGAIVVLLSAEWLTRKLLRLA
jgi:hypothetical protein